MRTITLRLPRPHESQREILEHPARYKVLNCGRRFGKTELFVHIALHGNSPSTQGMLNGQPIAYVALTEKNVNEFWGRLKNSLPTELVSSKNEVYKLLTMPTGGSLECWTFENFVTARGRAYAGIILDEAAITPNLLQAWSEVFQAMLLDYEGWAVFGSTPNGLNHFYTMYGYGLNESLDEWASFHKTSYDNPYIKASEIDKLKLTLPVDTFNREYLAQFDAGGGGVFKLLETQILLYPYKAPHTPEGAKHRNTYVMGIDWGQADDSTVASVFDATEYKEVAIYRKNHANYENMISNIVDLAHHWQVEKILPEKNSMGTPAIEMLFNEINQREWAKDPRTGYSSEPIIQAFTTTHKSKDDLVKLFIAGLESGLTLLPDDVANHELRAYQTKQTQSGLWTYSAPSGGHDDTVIARLLANKASYEMR